MAGVYEMNEICACGKPRRKRKDRIDKFWRDCAACHYAYKAARRLANKGRGMSQQNELAATKRTIDIMNKAFL